jgi:hypothetical protein
MPQYARPSVTSYAIAFSNIAIASYRFVNLSSFDFMKPASFRSFRARYSVKSWLILSGLPSPDVVASSLPNNCIVDPRDDSTPTRRSPSRSNTAFSYVSGSSFARESLEVELAPPRLALPLAGDDLISTVSPSSSSSRLIDALVARIETSSPRPDVPIARSRLATRSTARDVPAPHRAVVPIVARVARAVAAPRAHRASLRGATRSTLTLIANAPAVDMCVSRARV